MIELANVLKLLPKESTNIMGDFNINLLEENSSKLSNFEDVIYRHGFYPLISTATHLKPGCRPSCIDNILTNSPDQVVKSGTVSESTGHHLPVYQFLNTNIELSESSTKYIKLYDYCMLYI